MRLAQTIFGAALGLILGALSLPWVLYALGRAMLGDDEGADRAMEKSPLWRWWDWLGARRGVTDPHADDEQARYEAGGGRSDGDDA